MTDNEIDSLMQHATTVRKLKAGIDYLRALGSDVLNLEDSPYGKTLRVALESVVRPVIQSELENLKHQLAEMPLIPDVKNISPESIEK